MHEMSLMAELIQLVSEDAKQRSFKKIDKIEVIVGSLSNVLPEALEIAFFYFQQQGEALIDEKTQLQIIREAAKAKCQKCLMEFEPDYQIAICPKCGWTGCQLLEGETFRVESYEGSDGT
ncbi:hydrogenase maturation nickel metallochaperone HypA [Halobacillus sp. Marseille-Q1614]|uniref:hydrogenase maturation nickel metallochaperone HypA/HybF n=1 Tax=Halobacillus sp. Marseille-Q1614 TaxID=2709134 RepID=UPI00156D8C9D|nr:hydrogenase maturation nickel metallochaperone HypA [Halobacillus sp. Marseille-Q1614]